MSVRIRMKRMGRTHRPYYRICAIDKRAPRDGRVLEELGTYDTSIADTDARAVLKTDRIDYWLGVGAQPSEKVAVLIKKYGTDGTHKSQQEAALEKLAQPRVVPDPGKPASMPKKPEDQPKPEEATATPEASAATDEAATTTEETTMAETPAEETVTAEESAPVEEAASAEEDEPKEDAAS